MMAQSTQTKNLVRWGIIISAGLVMAAGLFALGFYAGTLRGQNNPGSTNNRISSNHQNEKSDQNGELQDPLLRSFDDVLGGASNLDSSDRNEARKILEEADPILTRIKQENRQAIRRINQPATVRRNKDPNDREPIPKQTKDKEENE